MFDYLAALDETQIRQDIGLDGGPLYIDIEGKNKLPLSVSQNIIMRIYHHTTTDDCLASYTPICLQQDDIFSNAPWIKSFPNWCYVDNIPFAYCLSLVEVKQVLEHCNRLSKLSVFW